MALWSLRQRPEPSTALMLEGMGAVLIIGSWWLATIIFGLPKSTLPTPLDVAQAFPLLWKQGVLGHAGYSIYLNLMTYVEAVAIALPVGFAMSLFGPIRSMGERWVTGFRFAPITAFIGIFIAWFGISHTVKIQFLVFGLLVYLLPTVIQRVDDVEQVYVDTAKTCGASRWQRFTSVFWPLAIGRLSDDCRSLVPIAWTYIIIAEGFNLGEGGLGALVSRYTRASRWDVVFALVVVILLIGFVQDRLWLKFDRKLFPWKHR